MSRPQLRAAARIAGRELRGGLSGFRIFLICLALGVAAIAAVGSVRTAIQAGLEREASALLGGDAEAEFTYRFATDEESAWLEENSDRLSEVVDFRSMAVADPDGAAERALTQVKGVDAAYPLFGSVALDPPMPLAQALAGADGLPGLVAAPALLDRLALAPGDVLRLGTQDFRLMAALLREPDGVTASFALGPRIIVATDALEGSGLITTGTLFETAYRLALPPEANVVALGREAQRRFRDAGLSWRDNRNGTPSVSRFVDRLSAFLVLVGLAGLAVGGVGVSAAVRSYIEGKTATIATLKTVGAQGGTIFAIYLMQIGVLALAGVGLGLVLGAGIPWLFAPVIEARLPVPAEFGLYSAPLAEAAFYGLMTALIFTLWPLARARRIRAAGLFRDVTEADRHLPSRRFIALIAALAGVLIAAATWLSDMEFLALWSAAGVLAVLGALLLAARGVRWLARRLAHSALARGRPSLRLALGAVGGPGGETAAVTLSLGLGLTVLATIGQIDSNLRGAIQREIPEIAPAYFFIDIQPDQLDGFLVRTRQSDGVTGIETAPMLRGILTRINGENARAYVRASTGESHWVLRGDRGVTYAATPPDGTEILAGDWWPEDYDGPPLLSFAEEEAREMGLQLGDEVTVNVLGRDLTATIANFRKVEFQDMGINFVMLLNPGALAGAPHTYIATVYADRGVEGSLLRTLGGAYPNITAISVREAIDQVTQALDGLAAAVRYGAAATLLTGFVVLIGAAAAGERRRVFEAAVLKTVGATRARILASFALRSAILGSAAGAVAILAGGLAGWGVMRFVMETDYVFEPVSALAIVAGGALAALLAGLVFAWRPLTSRPARVLRAQD
ncbi:FtsX-like permease family protein [Rhodobacteraceae bacterium 2CG4]|uniref:FtsX-like permease family protein n=1 Tax=Halovulum marinum TaxID=2662447 RepID=A0A6L5YZG9_9RHOB|nr:FtsX-like permease family protein [Halovulum marinum]MSU89696.1 FtsX-like permease family protein [Halovulum marinum]